MAGETRIDGLSRALARGAARRDLLRLLGIGAGGLLLARAPAGAQEAPRARPPCGPGITDCAACACPRDTACVKYSFETGCVPLCTTKNETWGLPACGSGQGCVCPQGTTCTFYGC